KNVYWHEVCFMSKRAWKFVKQFSGSFSTSDDIGVPVQIKNGPPELKRNFLQSFWDDEGSISRKGVLSWFSKSKRMIDDLIEMHRALGLPCSKGYCRGSNVHIIRVNGGVNNLILFSEKIGFVHSIVTKGHNLGKLKKGVLQDIIATKWAHSSVW
ncbi:MAG: LAGLIDADG family homing endonuclease, partial [Candidatus Diapherotrites archaeon]|nr:LAGLIDADG family homing endonuclease [Candidatus Diapherotrites archaeon]